MARKITVGNPPKRGDIVRLWGKAIIGMVVRHESFLGNPGFYAFKKHPLMKDLREDGIDDYTRHHLNNLIQDRAEVITAKELEAIYKKNPSNDLKILLDMVQKRKR